MRRVVADLLNPTQARWPSRLVLGFVTQSEDSERVKRALIEAERSWRTGTAKVISQARKAGVIDESLSPDAVAATLFTIRMGLVVQACIDETTVAENLRVVTRAVLLLLQSGRPLRLAV
jgi:hypothetical protein